MSDQYLGEVRMFGGDFAPRGWALCDGRLLSIAQNNALFSLLGTVYGGDGQTTFGLPDLRGRVPVHQGQGGGLSNRVMGEFGGTENVTLLLTQIPQHNHAAMASTNAGNQPGPASGVPATPQGTGAEFYVVPGANTVVPAAMAPTSIAADGGSLPHPNMMPSLCVSFIIALTGAFPSRN
jgi:microcystin-dependent protein